jgi:hypothetical protein
VASPSNAVRKTIFEHIYKYVQRRKGFKIKALQCDLVDSCKVADFRVEV